MENGLGHLFVTVGENLSYPEERLTRGAARELAEQSFASLSLVLVENPDALFPSVVVRADGADDGALVLHKLISGQADIRLTKGQWVSFTELEAWPLGTEPRRQQPDGTVPEGAYLVGTQLEPGCYRVELMDRAPLSDYDIYSGILCTDAHLIRIEVLHESVTLTLSEGEYIELSGCTLRPDAGDTEQENDQEG